MTANKQSNILVIIMDQLSAKALRAYGGRTAKTPNLDWLAETGTVFQNAYSNSPLCAPARFVFMSGQLPSRIGVYDNAAEFHSETSTFAHYLRLQGYQTALSGTMHFIGADQLHGFESRLTTDIYPADFGWTPDAENPDERFDWWMHNMLSVKQAGVAEYTNELEFDDETGHRAVQKLYDLTEDDIRNARHAYYANISYLDDWIGDLLRTLAETDQLDSTTILLTADHGDMVGERGLWYKMSFYEWSARVPLILRLPGERGGGRVETPISLLDVLPTLVDGASLLPLASREEDRTVSGEYMGEGAVAPLIMIRRGHYKYVNCEADPPQLFDLNADPNELRNPATETSHAGLTSELGAEVTAKWNPAALRDQVIASQHRRRLVGRALMTGRHTPWDYEPSQDDANHFMRNHLDLNDVEAKSRFPVPPYAQPLWRQGDC